MISSFGPGNIEGLYLIPFDKGHFNIANYEGTLNFNDYRIPTGYGVMQNLYLDSSGSLRARPLLNIYPHATAPSTKKLKFIISVGDHVIVGWDGENVKRGSGFGSWVDITDGGVNTLALRSNSIIGNQSFAITRYSGDWHIFGTTSMQHATDPYKSCVNFEYPIGTPTWANTAWDENIAVVGADENRIFYGVESADGPIVRYSERQDPATVGELSWFYVPNPQEKFADIINVGNTLYIITAGPTDVCGGISIYKKVLMGKSDDLIDMSSFAGVFSNNDISIIGAQSNPKNAITTCRGNIYVMTQQFGLCQVTDQGLLSVGAPILGDQREDEVSGGSGDTILASDERYGLVLCGRYNKGKTYVFDVVTRVWYEWTGFEIACRGYGTPERNQFGVKFSADYVWNNGTIRSAANTYLPALLGDLHTYDYANSAYAQDFTCNYYSSQLDFGHPFTEKQLRHLYIDGAGIREVSIYCRDNVGEAFTLLQTITTAVDDDDITGYVPIDSQHRWKEIYIKLTGKAAFKLNHLAAGVVTLRDYQWGF